MSIGGKEVRRSPQHKSSGRSDGSDYCSATLRQNEAAVDLHAAM